MLFIVQNSTLDTAREQNPRNAAGAAPPIFLMDPAANPDGVDHVQLTALHNSIRLGWEDLLGGGDEDFNDVVVNARTIRRANELPADESRLAPDERFIAAVYRDMLHRPVDELGLAVWPELLAEGISQSDVVTRIQTDPGNEFRSVQVQDLYERYLHRPADAPGLKVWVGVLASGGTVEEVANGIVSSTEYFQQSRVSQNNDRWLDAVYADT